ncbi:hypothetical protein [Pseudomonas sp. Irchel 3E13]|uniref:hypothetical protein n=1 Tax=Pseudomonas sp. Irchel 3E13 TaxID=2008975 RepID=UPI000BA2C645|nr:hypothetical protein [Pseudomonas sp. Irchel 3E13]
MAHTTTTTAQPYTVLPTTPATLHQKLGAYCVAWERTVLNAMRGLLGQAYEGGSYEIRQYLNGAIAMVLPEEGPKSVIVLGHNAEEITLEAASFVANLIAFSACNATAFENDDAEGNQTLHDLYFALKNAVSGRYDFVIDANAPEGTRPLNEAEMAKVLVEVKPHPESDAILRFID